MKNALIIIVGCALIGVAYYFKPKQPQQSTESALPASLEAAAVPDKGEEALALPETQTATQPSTQKPAAGIIQGPLGATASL